MLPTNHRWVYYYDFELQPYPADAPAFQLEPVLNQVEKAWESGKAVRKYENESLTVRIKDMNFCEDYIGLLINVSNINATDPAFSHTETGVVRTEQKKNGEGIGASCHVLFRKESIKENQSRYLALVEEVVGIPKSTIEKFLTYIFRNHCVAHYKNTASSSEKEKECRPRAKFKGHGSENLKTSLKEGELKGVILLNHNDTGYIDDEKQLRATERVVRLRATGKPKGNMALDAVRRAKEYGKKNGFDEIRVQFSEVVDEVTTKSASGKSKKREVTKQRTVKFESREENFANLIFTKSEMIKLTNEIGQCEEKIHSELENEMAKKLEKIKSN